MKKPKPLSMTSVAVLHAVEGGVGYGFDIMDAADLAQVRGAWDTSC